MLNYVISDRKADKWLVFIHGIGGSIKTWKKQMASFPGHNLLLIDLPGHGGSKFSKLKFNPDKINKEIRRVLNKLHIKSADFVALSLGSLVMAHFAAAYPQYVHSLIMGGSVLNIMGIYKHLVLLVNKINAYMPHRFMYNVFAHVILPRRNHEKSRKIFIRESLKMSRQSFLSWVSFLNTAINPDNLLQKLKDLNINMFFISGDEDNAFLKGTKATCQFLNDAKLHLIKHCGHVCSIEKANEFNCAVQDYLDTLPVAA